MNLSIFLYLLLYMSFIRKSDAMNYYMKCNKDDNKQIYLIAEDIKGKIGKKRFNVWNLNNLFYKMMQNKSNHYYEMWSEKDKILFALDIDMMNIDAKEGKKIVSKYILQVIKGAKDYYDYEYKMEDVIILQNDEIAQKYENPNKLSYHVIFRGLTFENHTVCKDFYTRLDNDYNMLYCDKSIYNMTCYRMCYSSKLGKNAILEPITWMINKQLTKQFKFNISEHEMRDQWKQTLITFINKNDKVIDKSMIINKLDILTTKIDTSNSSYDHYNLEKILSELPFEYCDDYDKWITIGMALHNASTDKNNYFELWNKWSQKSDKYKSSEMMQKWQSFNTSNNNKYNIATIMYYAKSEGIIYQTKNMKKSIDTIISSYPEKNIIISDFYAKDTCTINQNKLEPNIIEPYINKKLLAIQSEKGTGKTHNLLHVLFNSNFNIDKNTSILFISSRRTFGIKLLSDLKQFGFSLYSEIKDHYINSKRIICQIDSLMRLDRDIYDLVIIDEAESLARYLTSTHFTKNQKASLIVNSLELRVKDAKHTYIMDADLSDRCLNYFTQVIGKKGLNIGEKNSDFKLLINQYHPYKNYTIKYMSYNHWLCKIFDDIENNKKLVIPMASNNKAKDLTTKIIQDFPDKKILLIHKETSDEEKLEKLLKVNDIWNQYDILIYTPSVCMGVSFDVPDYFDNIYAYGCTNSLGAQEFCQMLHRVRKPKSSIIYLAMDYYKEFDIDDNITYSTVEYMLCSDYYLTNYDLHNNIVYKKIDRINEDDIHEKILVYPYKEEAMYDLYVRNSKEVIENKINFSKEFFGYVKFKSYKLEYISDNDKKTDNLGNIISDMKTIKIERETLENNNNIDGILNAQDISKDEYLIKIKQKEEFLTDNDIFAMKRYNIIQCYNLNKYTDEKSLDHIMTRDFIEKYSDKLKMRWYKNITTILSNDTQTTEYKLTLLQQNAQYNKLYTTCYTDFTMKNKYIYHSLALKIINMTGFDINNLSKTQTQANLLPLIDDCIIWCENHKLELANKFDVKIINRKLTEFERLGDKLKIINNIIQSQYGLIIKKIKQSNNLDKILYSLIHFSDWNELNTIVGIDIENNHDNTNVNELNDIDTSILDI